MTSLSSVSTLFSSCMVLRSTLSLGYNTNMALACLHKFFGIAEYDCVDNQTYWLPCLPEIANSNSNCLRLSRQSLAIISSMIKSVSEHANNCDNFLIH